MLLSCINSKKNESLSFSLKTVLKLFITIDELGAINLSSLPSQYADFYKNPYLKLISLAFPDVLSLFCSDVKLQLTTQQRSNVMD